jgi:hypothetical protein
MAWGGSAPNQTYTRTDGVRSGAGINVTARTNGVNNTAELADAREQDMAVAINLTWKRDGGNQPIANLPMNGYRFTGMGAGEDRGDGVRVGQVQDGVFTWGGVAGGTASAITLTLDPAITAYAAGQLFLFEAAEDSTGATDVNINGVGSANLFKFDGTVELAAGDIQDGGIYLIGCDGTDFHLIGGLAPSLSPMIPLTPAADRFVYFTSATAAVMGTITAAGRALLDDADNATQRTTLGLGTMAVETAANYLTKADNLNSVADKPTAFANIKQTATSSASGVLEVADQTEMEAASAADRAVTPGNANWHPGMAKCWGVVNFSGGTPTLAASHNITSITDLGVGETRFTIATDFSSANWSCQVTHDATAAGFTDYHYATDRLAGTVTAFSQDNGGSGSDGTSIQMVGFGDQ